VAQRPEIRPRRSRRLRLGRVLAVEPAAPGAGRVWLWREGRREAAEIGPGEALRPGDLVRLTPRGARLVGRPRRGDALAPGGDLGRLLADGGRRDAALRERSALLHGLRVALRRRGLLEVETPAIAPCPGLELHLDPVEVRLREGMAGAATTRYLVTSPEYHCKRLLHAGLTHIFSLARAFRSGEQGGQHNPEFTMLEWYRAGEPAEAALQDVLGLVAVAADAVARDRRRRGDARPVWRPGPPLRLSFAAALARFAGVRLQALPAALAPRRAALARAVAAAGAQAREGDGEADLLLALFAERVEPALAAHDLVIIERWPACLASLARRLPEAPELAERFEVYLRGVELANGFGELTDAAEQRARLERDLTERARRGLATPPLDERFLTALERGCPPAAGVALGVDRLLMAVGGYDAIADVLAFPFDLA
jgi:lysyl-tRNA synthetase class 2